MSLLLVDGNGLCCKLWYGHAHETPERFANVVHAIADGRIGGHATERDPMRVVVAWDAPGGSWRREVYPAYKARRTAKPEALTHALIACRKIPGVTHLETPGFEADDIIGTLTRALNGEGGAHVYILSADKDFAQLVSDYCWMIDERGGLTTPAEVVRKFGVPPGRMRLWLSWAGDTSDGLPGVRGIGKKRAIAKAMTGEVGDPLTYALVELAHVPELEPR